MKDIETTAEQVQNDVTQNPLFQKNHESNNSFHTSTLPNSSNKECTKLLVLES